MGKGGVEIIFPFLLGFIFPFLLGFIVRMVVTLNIVERIVESVRSLMRRLKVAEWFPRVHQKTDH